jgi:hypothetical protein
LTISLFSDPFIGLFSTGFDKPVQSQDSMVASLRQAPANALAGWSNRFLTFLFLHFSISLFLYFPHYSK